MNNEKIVLFYNIIKEDKYSGGNYGRKEREKICSC